MYGPNTASLNLLHHASVYFMPCNNGLTWPTYQCLKQMLKTRSNCLMIKSPAKRWYFPCPLAYISNCKS